MGKAKTFLGCQGGSQVSSSLIGSLERKDLHLWSATGLLLSLLCLFIESKRRFSSREDDPRPSWTTEHNVMHWIVSFSLIRASSLPHLQDQETWDKLGEKADPTEMAFHPGGKKNLNNTADQISGWNWIKTEFVIASVNNCNSLRIIGIKKKMTHQLRHLKGQCKSEELNPARLPSFKNKLKLKFRKA